MTQRKIIQGSILAIAIAFIYPPVYFKKVTSGRVEYISDGHRLLIDIPAKYSIDMTMLFMEIAIILCIVAFLYYRYRNNSFNAALTATKTPTVKNDWIVGGVHVGDDFYKANTGIFLGKIVSSTLPTKISCGGETAKFITYKGEYGYVQTIDRKISCVHTWKTGIKISRNIIIGKSTVHDVLNTYGLRITRVVNKLNTHTYIYSQESANLSLIFDEKGLLIGVTASIPCD